jgi:membrane-associated phospholipid phosphatase
MSKRIVLLTATWIIAFVVALSLDYPIAYWVHTSGFGKQVMGKWWAEAIKIPGTFAFTAGVAVLLAILRKIRWKQAVFLVLAGIVVGANPLIKWMAGRWRPYKFPGTDANELRPFAFRPFAHGFSGLFNQHDLCFPSGHECEAAALAVAMIFVWRGGAWVFVLLAILVGIERPAENAHYASDVVGAVGFAMLTTALLHKALSNWMTPNESRGFEAIVPEPQKASP